MLPSKINPKESRMSTEHTPNPFRVGQAVFAVKSGRLMGYVTRCSKPASALSHWAEVGGMTSTVFSEDLGKFFTLEAPTPPFHIGHKIYRIVGGRGPLYLGSVAAVGMNEFGGWHAVTKAAIVIPQYELTNHSARIGRRQHPVCTQTKS